MELDSLFELSGINLSILLIAAAALIVAIIAVFAGTAARRRVSEQQQVMKQRVDSLWADVSEWRVSQFNGSIVSGEQDATASDRFCAEKAAYDVIWPMVWSLHEKLGLFLRAVEAEENAGELRLEARTAALDARKVLNRVRPFCHGDVDELMTQLIDHHIKAHLAACHLMDLRKESLSSGSNHEMAVQREKFHMLYDGQAKEMLSQLVTLIRGRMLR